MDELAAGLSGDLAPAVLGAVDRLRATTQTLLQMEMSDRFGGAVPYTMAFARVLGAAYHLRAAATGDPARGALAGYFGTRLLPEAEALMAQARAGSDGLYDLSPDDLAA